MRYRHIFPLLLLALALPFIASGCKAKAKVTPKAPAAPAEPSAPAPRDTGSEVPKDPWKGEKIEDTDIDEANLPTGMSTVYFAFDSYELTPSSVATLRQNADSIKASRSAKILIEGHCDERGSIEYNLALGEKRAAAVRDYLSSLGVERNRLRITTLGEERPAAQGHNEAAYSKNRRAEFIPER